MKQDAPHVMKIAGYKNLSFVDGEGIRFAIFTTGCIHNCEGCHSKDLQDYNYGLELPNAELLDKISENKDWLNGITLSGGDPLFQLDHVVEFLKQFRADERFNHMDVWLYTGYDYEEIPKSIRGLVDVIVDGKYDKTLKEGKYRGSINQRIMVKYNGTTHFIKRVYPEETNVR